jgi:hypothetical protein
MFFLSATFHVLLSYKRKDSFMGELNMRTLHFHPLSGLHRPQWLHYRLHIPHTLSEPWFWAAMIFISLIVIASLLAIFVPSPSAHSMPYPVYFP